jgi:hypothetical protein
LPLFSGSLHGLIRPPFALGSLFDHARKSEDPFYGRWQSRAARRKGCHSYVTNGRIQFLSDCHHSLAGQTVELPDWD